jgi:uncharacterized protein
MLVFKRKPNKENPMKRIWITALAVLAGAAIVSACGVVPGLDIPAYSPRLLTVGGTGTVTLTPDVAYINVGVHTEMPTAAEAVSANNTQTMQVISALQTAGVQTNDIQTSNFSIYPNAQYDPQTNQKLGTTYVVDNSVYVTARDISKLGALLDATVAAGANSVNSIQFDVADKSAAIKQARDEAVKDARGQAEGLAAATGLSLGAIHSVEFSNTAPTPSTFALGRGGGAAEAAVPIQTGQLSLTVTVNISYEIK